MRPMVVLARALYRYMLLTLMKQSSCHRQTGFVSSFQELSHPTLTLVYSSRVKKKKKKEKMEKEGGGGRRKKKKKSSGGLGQPLALSPSGGKGMS